MSEDIVSDEDSVSQEVSEYFFSVDVSLYFEIWSEIRQARRAR
jgi:hypothetical protein